MALSNTTLNLLRTQYYDDFYEASVASPNVLRGNDYDFHRILFRPGYPVQSRELTQLQTILQTQIERFGLSAFKNGDVVIGGELILDTNVIAGKVAPTANLQQFYDRATATGQVIVRSANDVDPVRAKVTQFVSADEGVTSDNYLLFKYLDATRFAPGDGIQVLDDPTRATEIASGSEDVVFRNASTFSLGEGVFFISGIFVRVVKQTIVLDHASSRPSYRIGLAITEDVIDELTEDIGETLLDPANLGAPGAHRFRIRAVLAKRPLSAEASANFIELARVIDGVLQKPAVPAHFVRLDELNDILARRTHDESGNYVVRNFAPVLEAHPTDEDKFVLSLGPGKAYIRGYEVETTEPTKLAIRKGRVTENVALREISTQVGSYAYVTRVAATSPSLYFGNTFPVTLHCVPINVINTTDNTVFSYSKIGTCRVRMIETDSVPADTALHANSTYKLFFYDVQFDQITGNVHTALSNTATGKIDISIVAQAGIPVGENANGALTGTTIILSGANSPVTGTFTIENYRSNNTSNAIATLREVLPTLPNANTQFRILVQPKDIESFAIRDENVLSINAPYSTRLAFQATISPDNKSKLLTGETIVHDQHNNGLVYQIPERFVRANTITSNTAVFTSWVQTSANAQVVSSASVPFTLELSGTGAEFTIPVGTLSAAEARQHFIVFDQTSDDSGRGRIVQFADTAGSASCLTDCVVSKVGQVYRIAFNYRNTNTGTSRSLLGLARTTIVGLAPRQKRLIVGNTTTYFANTTSGLQNGQIEFHSLNVSSQAVWSLKTADIYRLRKVLYKSANTEFTTADLSTATDVTQYFTLDDGQRDNVYEWGQLRVKPGANTVMAATGRVLVIFDWFEHSGRGYITVDSYLNSINDGKLTYDTIPTYTSSKFSVAINLREVLDFRPRRASRGSYNGAFIFSTLTDTDPTVSYEAQAGQSYYTPVSNEDWLGGYQYYLSRIDKIALGYDGQFQIVEGQDAVEPVAPVDVLNALLLFQLRVPAYTLVNASGIPENVSVSTFHYKRFTMQDIAKVENRVAHLEYYTALNSLERITRDQSELDLDGNERFKNGFVVDAFHGGDVADISTPTRQTGHTAAIDTVNRELRTAFRTFNTQFVADTVNSTSFGMTVIGDMAIPTYTTAPFITQPLATHAISVNPFDVASFYGRVRLSPSVDIWKDTTTRPAQTIDVGGPSADLWAADLPSIVVWGEWEQTWTGSTSTTQRMFYTPNDWDPDRHAANSMLMISWNDVETKTTWARQGTTFEYEVSSTTESLGNRVVDVSVIHHMRARDVVFAADGLKPQANVYTFFDSRDVSGYIQEANQLTLDPVPTPNVPLFQMGQTVYVKTPIAGTTAVQQGAQTLTGTSTVYQNDLVVGQLLHIQQGTSNFMAWVSAISTNTAATLTATAGGPGAPVTLAAATVYTLTPVTIADVAARIDGNTTRYTLKVVRAVRDADADAASPYTIVAGALGPNSTVVLPDVPVRHTNDVSGTVGSSVTAMLVGGLTFNVAQRRCVSGVVRNWNSGTFEVRLEQDVDATTIVENVTTLRIVAGPGANARGTITSFNTTTKIAVVSFDGGVIPPLVAGQSLYSIGQPRTDGFLSGDIVVTGRAGTVAGVFHLPGGAFPTGTRQFRLTDSATNTPEHATTAADTTYEASGLMNTEQETFITSRSLSLQRKGPVSESFTTTERSVTNFDQQYVDPLAQNFLVDARQYPQGVFITSVDVCFGAKPVQDIPVTLEIRDTVNGYPSSHHIVPCVSAEGMASVTLRNDQVRVKDRPDFNDVTAYTRFTLPAPVHLLAGREYAIVIRSDSSDYMVYVAELGKTVIGTPDSIVSKQPYAGAFFKSQNASTWTESPYEDLMFRLNRAVWNASENNPLSARLIARGIAPASNTYVDSLEFFPHTVNFADYTLTSFMMDIKPMNQNTGDLTDSVAIRYSLAPNQWRPLAVRSMLQGRQNTAPVFSANGNIGAANTIDMIVSLTTRSPHVAPFIDMKKMNIIGIQHWVNHVAEDDVTELAPTHGVALTRYLTKPVTLADGFDAQDLTVYFDAYRPRDAKFYVYYRILPGNSNQKLDDQPWRKMVQVTPDSVFSAHYQQFKEFKFRTPEYRAASGTDVTDVFRTFAIKIVMSTTNTVNAPRITNFRALALDA